jgi:hypothetical protein
MFAVQHTVARKLAEEYERNATGLLARAGVEEALFPRRKGGPFRRPRVALPQRGLMEWEEFLQHNWWHLDTLGSSAVLSRLLGARAFAYGPSSASEGSGKRGDTETTVAATTSALTGSWSS